MPISGVSTIAVTGGGSGYLSPPAVTITGGGGSATATAVLNANGAVTAINVVNADEGFAAPPTVTIAAPSAPATATATIGFAGATETVNSIQVTNGGAGYLFVPTVTLVGGGGTGATATAVLSNGTTGFVTAIKVSGGSGYTLPPVVVIAPPQSTATAVATVTGGKPNSPLTLTGGVAAIGLNAGGVGYTSNFAVTFNGGGGSGAAATAIVNQFGAVASVLVTNPGSGYTSAPTISFANGSGTGATAVAFVLTGGSGYLAASANTTLVTFSGGGTGASGAIATATVVNGVITAITSAGGTNYTVPPTVQIAAPLVQATATATVTAGNTVNNIVVPATTGGAGYSSAVPPLVTIGPPNTAGGVQATAFATVVNGAVTAITMLNPGTGYTSAPTVTIAPPQATATAVADLFPTTVTPVNGVATFTGLTLNNVVTGTSLAASTSGIANPVATTSTFAVGVAADTQLVVNGPAASSSVALGGVIPVTVTAVDAAGNPDPNFNDLVTIALATNPGAATLGGTIAVQAVNGVATFTNLTLNRDGNGYSLMAFDGTLGSATTNLFNVTATQLVVTGQPPLSVAAGQTFSITVKAEDGFGNPGSPPSSTDLCDALRPVVRPGAVHQRRGDVQRVELADRRDGIHLHRVRRPVWREPRRATVTVIPGLPMLLAVTTPPPGSVAVNSPFNVAISVEDANSNLVPSLQRERHADDQHGPRDRSGRQWRGDVLGPDAESGGPRHDAHGFGHAEQRHGLRHHRHHRRHGRGGDATGGHPASGQQPAHHSADQRRQYVQRGRQRPDRCEHARPGLQRPGDGDRGAGPRRCDDPRPDDRRRSSRARARRPSPT